MSGRQCEGGGQELGGGQQGPEIPEMTVQHYNYVWWKTICEPNCEIHRNVNFICVTVAELQIFLTVL